MFTIAGSTIDSLFYQAIRAFPTEGTLPSRNGPMKQITGVSFCLSDPMSCVLRNTLRKANPAYAAGELLWYLRQSDSLEIIQYYTQNYHLFSDNGRTLHGAYGKRLQRLASARGYSHFIPFIIDWLKRDPSTRRLYLPLYNMTDVDLDSKDIPCTTGLQFILDGKRLDMITDMRSNDLWLGFPYDVFCFCAIQCLVALYGGWMIGTYHHHVGSLHIYEKDMKKVTDAKGGDLYENESSGFLKAGREPHSGRNFMDDLEEALRAESAIRDKKFEKADFQTDFTLLNQMVDLAMRRHFEGIYPTEECVL